MNLFRQSPIGMQSSEFVTALIRHLQYNPSLWKYEHKETHRYECKKEKTGITISWLPCFVRVCWYSSLDTWTYEQVPLPVWQKLRLLFFLVFLRRKERGEQRKAKRLEVLNNALALL